MSPAPFQCTSARVAILVSLALLFAASLPLWWATTSITRLPLPATVIEDWAKRGACPVQVPITVNLVVDSSALDAAAEGSILQLQQLATAYLLSANEQLRNSSFEANTDSACLRWSVTVSRELPCAKAGKEQMHRGDSTWTDGHSVHICGPSGCSSSSPPSCSDKLVDLLVPARAINNVTAVADVVTDALGQLLWLPSSHNQIQESTPVSSQSLSQAVPHTSDLRLVFSLLNEDATKGYAIRSWDIQAVLQTPTHAMQELLHEYEGIHNFTIESQVQWFAPLAFAPRQVPGDLPHWLVEWDNLHVFVNAAEWPLEAGLSDVCEERSSGRSDPSHCAAVHEQVLNFILYVPASDKQPLLIQDPLTGGPSKATGWVIPQWGGVVILNKEDTNAQLEMLSPTAAAAAFDQFAQQLSVLLGHQEAPRATNQISLALVQHRRIGQKILESSRDSIASLQGIVRLIKKLPNLGLGYEVQQDINISLQFLTLLEESFNKADSGLDNLRHALYLSSAASSHASSAFFNPSMLGLLYFPDEHKWAVYTPLFGPIAVPILVACVQELKRHFRKK